ncbi:leucine-rich repeat protein, partial [Enterococcus faecalis]|nr:leucine-rich repeat protein [Enterococcus faecalis]
LVEIKPFAFQRNLELKKVDLPNSVSKIGKLAFYDNWKLEDIKIPSSVEELSPYTLYNVPKLKCIEFGENIKTIPENFIGGILEELQTVKVASRDHFKITATSFPVNKIDSILFMVPNEDIAKEMTKVGINREKITIASETTEPTSNTESSKATESTSSTESSEATEPTSSTKSSEATESTSSTESSEATEPTSSTESSETTEPTSSTESSKATESTSSTESSEAMGIIGSSRDKLKTTKNRIENKNLPKTGEQRNLFLSSVG